MCTLIIAWRAFETAPVVVAANRDEVDGRPSSPPARRPGRPAVVAPRDERAGGTWIGYNDAGLFAGISNRWMDEPLDAGRSRGLLVGDALERSDVEGAIETVRRAVERESYDGFNLVLADESEAVLLEWDGRLGRTDLEPGVHVVMNAGHDDRFRSVEARSEAAAGQAESAARLREALVVEPDEGPEEWLERAATALSDHDDGVCVHGDGFGTQSASLVLLRADGRADYWYADGPPCTASFEPVEGQS